MDAADRPGRVIVGVDTGLAGLQALRVAVTEARIRGAALHAVRTWQPTPPPSGRSTGLPGRDLPPTGPGTAGPGATAPGIAGLGIWHPGLLDADADTGDPALPWAGGPSGIDPDGQVAMATIVEAFAETMGGPPPDVHVQLLALPDPAARALVEYACRDGDLLVLGAPRRGRWRRLWGGSTVRGCLARAGCPVLVVPPPPLARRGSPRALLRELRREIDELAGPGPEL